LDGGTGILPVPGQKPTPQSINTQNKFDGGTGILPVPDAIVIFLGRARSPTPTPHKINTQNKFVFGTGSPARS